MKQLHFTFFLLFVASLLIGQTTSEMSLNADSVALDDMRKQVETLFGQGKYKEAVEAVRELLPKAEKTFGKESAFYGNCLDDMGVMLQHAGNLPEAEQYLKAGVEHARTYVGIQHQDYVLHLNNLGMLYLAIGDFGAAQVALNEAVERGETVLGEGDATFGVLVNNLGLVCENALQLENALKHYYRALDITGRTAGKEDARYATRLGNIGAVYRKLKQYDKALPLFNEALVIAEKKLGKDHPRYIVHVRNLATTYRVMKDFEKALPLTQEVEALSLKKYGPSHPEYLINLGDMGSVYVAMGRYHEGRDAFMKEDSLANLIFKNGRHWRFRSVLNLELALVNQAMHDYDKADHYFSTFVGSFTRDTQRNFDLMNQKEQETYLTDWDDMFRKMLSFGLRHPDRATIMEHSFDMNLIMKGLTLGYRRRLLDAVASNADAQTASTFQEWQTLHKELSKQYSLTEEKRIPDFKEKLLQADELERQLAVASTDFQEARQLSNWRDVQAALQPGEAAIEFCNFEYHRHGSVYTDSFLYVALLLRKGDTVPRIVYLFEEKQLGNLKATRRLYAHASTDGATLHDLVWKPLAEHLDGISTIYYSPAGLLSRVNLGAIPVSAEQTISQRYQLHEMGSTRQLVLRQRQQVPLALKNATVYGGIEYDAFPKEGQGELTASKDRGALDNPTRGMQENLLGMDDDGWVELAGTKREAEAIQQLLKDAGAKVVLRKGYEASEDDFKEMGQQKTSPTIVHLATHGFFFPDSDETAMTGFGTSEEPMIRCGLALAGANEVWEGNPPPVNREDGILTAYEISHLNLSNTELVVLSACDTGLGELKGNEGVYGLQRAFKIAGAHYVLMSLWNVSDRQTEEFMTAFYKEWLEKKLEIPEAFQSAQNQLKEKYSKPYNPSLWAGFVLVE